MCKATQFLLFDASYFSKATGGQTRPAMPAKCILYMSYIHLARRQRRDVAASTARYGSHLSKSVENIGKRLGA